MRQFQETPGITLDTADNDRLWSGAFDLANEMGGEALQLLWPENVIAAASAAKQLKDDTLGLINEPASTFGANGNEKGFLVIRGVQPPQELIDTYPERRRLPPTVVAGAGKLVAVALAGAFGHPFTLAANPRGAEAFVNFVAPEKEFSVGKSNASANDTEWHFEVPGMFRPRAVLLYGIRSQAEVATKILSPLRLLDRLDPDEAALLREGRFVTSDSMLPLKPRESSPVIVRTEQGTQIVYDSEHTDPFDKLDTEACAILGRLAVILDEPSLSSKYVIQQGDVLVFDNFGLHRRGSFKPNEKTPRMLFRVFIGDDRHRPEGPIVGPRFRDTIDKQFSLG